jgi:hypothetical protein
MKTVKEPVMGVAKAAAPVALVVACLMLSAGPMSAAGQSVSKVSNELQQAPITQSAGGAIQETPLLADDRPDLFGREDTARAAFGFTKGAKRSGRHVHDGLQNLDYDEVTEVDSKGQPSSLVQFDSKGGLVAAVRFDSPASTSGVVSADAATKAARKSLQGVGMAPDGNAQTSRDDASGGWAVQWQRTSAGHTVRGDETLVRLGADGRIQSVAAVTHGLAAMPATQLAQADARAVVARQCSAWFSGKGSGYNVGEMDLEWVGPNAAFDGSKLESDSDPYRLAWVVNVVPTGAAADSTRLVTLYVDAGSGAVIGGDVVE